MLAIAERAENEVAALLGGTGRVESVAEMVALVEQGLRLLVANLSFTRTLWLEAWADDEILREFAVAWLKVLHARIQVFIEGNVWLDQPVELTVNGHPDVVFTGRVVSIADRAEFAPRNVATEEERESLVFAVDIRIKDTGGILKPGMPAGARFLAGAGTD